MTADVLFIGLDSAEPDIIERFAATGIMPNVARLLDRATTVPLRSNEHLPGTCWPELATGRLGSRSGIYFPPGQIINGSSRLERMTSDYLESDSWYWVVAASQGLQVASIDMVHSALTDCGAVELVEWGSHDRMISPTGSDPTELLEQIGREHGPYPVHNCDRFHHASSAGYRKLRASLDDAAGKKGEVAAGLLERQHWDLFSVVFTETHCACHQLWHFHDPSSPRHRSGDDVLGTSYEDVHRSVDRSVGRVLESAGPSCDIVLSAIKGAGLAVGGHHLLNDVLAALDLAPDRSLKGNLWDAVPVVLKGQLTRLPQGVRRRIPMAADPGIGELVHPARTLRNDQAGALRLSIAGRETDGVLRPDEADAVLARIEAELLALRMTSNGRPVVREVIRCHEAYGEAANPDLPDITVVFDSTLGLIEDVEGPASGRIRRPYRRLRSGDHTGSARAWIASDRVVHGEGERAICDVSAAMLAMAGAEPPATYDGNAAAVIDG